MSPVSFLWVFIGGGLGSVARYGIALLCGSSASDYPWATFWANLAACLLLGILLGLNAQQLLSSQTRLLLMTGFCGGFSTFSTFSGENLQLLTGGQTLLFFAYITGSILAGLLCIFLGLKAGQYFGG